MRSAIYAVYAISGRVRASISRRRRDRVRARNTRDFTVSTVMPMARASSRFVHPSAFCSTNGVSQRRVEALQCLGSELPVDIFAFVILPVIFNLRIIRKRGSVRAGIGGVHKTLRLMPAQLHERFVDGDAEQPGGKLGLSLKASDVVIGLHQHVLHVVLRVFAVLQHAQRNAINLS